MYDLIIIGAGPAGFSAAIYAARREMKVLMISREIGGQVAWASEIENYPGIPHIGAFDLIAKMQAQIKSLGVEIKNTEVIGLEKRGEKDFVVKTAREEFSGKTVVLCLGLTPRKLGIPSEDAFAGKGVSYCANCDGPLYKGKIIGVVGGGNAALDAAEVLSKIGSQVYLFMRSNKFRAFDKLVEEVKNRPNIKIFQNTEVREILGDGKMEKLLVENNQTGERQELPADALFIEIGREAKTEMPRCLIDRDEYGHIEVDLKCQTKTPGLFAAGDTTALSEFKQITVAVGQGTIAALAAYQYLQDGGVYYK